MCNSDRPWGAENYLGVNTEILSEQSAREGVGNKVGKVDEKKSLETFEYQKYYEL